MFSALLKYHVFETLVKKHPVVLDVKILTYFITGFLYHDSVTAATGKHDNNIKSC